MARARIFSAPQNFSSALAWVDACQRNMPFAKSWCFACNNPCIQHVAARCNHPTRHASVAGVRNSSGQFLSTLTAEYPTSLAANVVKHCAFKVKRDPMVRELRKPSIATMRATRLKVCDGAGMRSTADHSVPHTTHPHTGGAGVVATGQGTTADPKISGPRPSRHARASFINPGRGAPATPSCSAGCVGAQFGYTH